MRARSAAVNDARRGEGDLVEERLVVVGGDVVDGLLRIEGVGALRRTRSRRPATRDEAVPAQVPGQPRTDLVHLLEEAVPLGGARLIETARRGEEPGGEPLLAAIVEGASSARGVAQAIVEGADTGPGHVPLRRVHAALALPHLAEVPPFAVEVDRRAVHAVALRRERVQRVARRSPCCVSCDDP